MSLFEITIILCVALYSVTAAEEKPNIVFILADDLGWNDVSFHGSQQIPTPNIDSLASTGIILNNYYVSPICTPSRSALLTGKHPIHTGMQHDVIYGSQPYGVSLKEKLLPQYLKDLGYATHMVGKWHLGFFNKAYSPLYRGFDSHAGYYCGHQDYFDHTAQESTSTWGFDMRRFNMSHWKEATGFYTTELFTSEAVNLIQEHDTSQPLFLYLAHLAVHSANTYTPLEALPEDIARFTHIQDERRRTFAGMMAALDRSVGKVVQALHEKNMLTNSVIVFSTDNGGPANGFDLNAASNWPLKGTKDTLWEGGVRGSALIWSPLLNQTERVSDQLMHISDWLPTLLHAAGYQQPLPEIDGVDMWKALSLNEESPRTEVLHNIDDLLHIAALRVGDYKIVIGRTYNGQYDNWYPPWTEKDEHNEIPAAGSSFPSDIDSIVGKYRKRSGPLLNLHSAEVTCEPVPPNATLNCQPQIRPCLFNIRSDPCEFHNIAEAFPQIVQNMLERLGDYNSTAVAPRNLPNDPRGYPQLHNYNWDPWVSDDELKNYAV